MRRLATIRLVDEVFPIENADRLEQVAIGGWRVVVGKGEFKKGDKIVYFEIDSALPVTDERYNFLKERCLKRWMNHGELILETIRIKSIKLRGVVSQGLVMPFESFTVLVMMLLKLLALSITMNSQKNVAEFRVFVKLQEMQKEIFRLIFFPKAMRKGFRILSNTLTVALKMKNLKLPKSLMVVLLPISIPRLTDRMTRFMFAPETLNSKKKMVIFIGILQRNMIFSIS